MKSFPAIGTGWIVKTDFAIVLTVVDGEIIRFQMASVALSETAEQALRFFDGAQLFGVTPPFVKTVR